MKTWLVGTSPTMTAVGPGMTRPYPSICRASSGNMIGMPSRIG
jgi:hypothetical protein